MKSQFKKATAVALAMAMCVPGAALAADAAATSGSFNTSFDVYSPTLHVSVPLTADIKVNPLAVSSDTTVKKFSVASNSIDIINASVDTEADAAIPVNVTVKAAIRKTGTGVMTEYNEIDDDATSTKKKIWLKLSQAGTAAQLKAGTIAADSTGKLVDLSKAEFDSNSPAQYNSISNETTITKYGSLLSVDIAKPTTTESNGSFTADPTKVAPQVGSFAVTGVAYTNADWKADDIAVDITYNVKASNALSITTPAVTAVSVSANNTADVTITVPNIGEATVLAMAIHNDGEKLYGDYKLEGYKVEYGENATTSGQIDATITIPKDHATLAYLADEANGCKAKAQDLIIGLSDGRMVVSTLTVN